MDPTGTTTWENPGASMPAIGRKLSQSAAARITIALLATVFGLFTATTVLTSCDSGQAPEEALTDSKASVVIGTASMTGLYFHTGNLIARAVNSGVEIHGIQSEAKSTNGSVFNINEIMTGAMEFGIAQSDLVYEAVEGSGIWKQTGPQKDLRAMFSLHAESVVLVAADDAGINTMQDLRGKRVDIGEPGSASRQNAIHALENAGIDYTKDLDAKGFRTVEVAALLRKGGIDAFFFTVGHPNIILLDATTSRRSVYFVPITEVNKLLKKYPYYTKETIPTKFYPRISNQRDVESFGVKATFVTSAKMPDKVVYTITKQVFEKIESYRTLHPAFADLTKAKMLECLAVPVHPGAKKYYDEAGLVPSFVVK
jgi:TRAP transporter TAXI family solute receptor